MEHASGPLRIVKDTLHLFRTDLVTLCHQTFERHGALLVLGRAAQIAATSIPPVVRLPCNKDHTRPALFAADLFPAVIARFPDQFFTKAGAIFPKCWPAHFGPETALFMMSIAFRYRSQVYSA